MKQIILNKSTIISASIFVMVWVNSLLFTNDLINWCIENILTFLTVFIIIGTYKYYKFSGLSYALIALFLCLHVFGSKYTYAENPFGFWIQDFLNLERNPYDRIVHFAFGLLLYMPMKEFFLKKLSYPKHLAIHLPTVLVLALSGGFEIIEWLVADIFFPTHGDAYLGLQGDIWDAQKDMALAFIGALLSSIIFYKKNGFVPS